MSLQALNRKAHEDAKRRKQETQERLRQHAQQITALKDIFSLIDEDEDGMVDKREMLKVHLLRSRLCRYAASTLFAFTALTAMLIDTASAGAPQLSLDSLGLLLRLTLCNGAAADRTIGAVVRDDGARGH